MLGLIKKDLLMIKSNLKMLLIIFFVYGVMAYQGEMNISFLLPFMSVAMMITTFSYDAYNKWDAYTITLPNGRKNSVKAKYLSTVILITVTTLISMFLSFTIEYYKNNSIDLENTFSSLLGNVFAIVILQSVMYPSIYKFGVEKARIGLFVVVFGVAIIAGIVSNYIDFDSIIKTLNILNNYWMIIIPIITILVLYISYKVSENIYNKKEY